jgi:hypothetical protein
MLLNYGNKLLGHVIFGSLMQGLTEFSGNPPQRELVLINALRIRLHGFAAVY